MEMAMVEVIGLVILGVMVAIGLTIMAVGFLQR